MELGDSTIQSNTNSHINYSSEYKFKYEYFQEGRQEHKQQLPCDSVIIMMYGNSNQKLQ